MPNDPNLGQKWVVYAIGRYSGRKSYVGRDGRLTPFASEARDMKLSWAARVMKCRSKKSSPYIAAWGMTTMASAIDMERSKA